MDDNVKNEITLLINDTFESDVSECIRFGRDWIEDLSSVQSYLDVTYHPDRESTDIFGIVYLDDRLLPSMPVLIRYWLGGQCDEELHIAPQSDVRYRIKVNLVGECPEKFDLDRSDIVVCEIVDRKIIEGGLEDER